MTSIIGRIHRVPLRDVWPHEAIDFTKWLGENVEVLGETIGKSLALTEREAAAGTLSIDLVVEDDSGSAIVVENQLERSNHDHLGKIVTYLSVWDAKTAVWVVADPRPEHITAISWLNESSPADFYLVKIEAVRIGESAPAPLMTLITGPSDEVREVGTKKKELAEQQKIRLQFWTELLEKARVRTNLHSGISAGSHGWIGSGAGLPPGLSLNYVIRQHEGQVELYIDRGSGSGDQNLADFNRLQDARAEIEASFGGELEWDALAGRRACRIRKVIPGVGWRDEDGWEGGQERMIDAMIRLHAALKPHLQG